MGTHYVRSAAFSADAAHVLTCSSDWTARLWSVGLCICRHTFSGHEFWVNSAMLSVDATLLLTASRDHTIKLWRVGTGSCELTLGSVWNMDSSEGAHVDFVTSAAFLPAASSNVAGTAQAVAIEKTPKRRRRRKCAP